MAWVSNLGQESGTYIRFLNQRGPESGVSPVGSKTIEHTHITAKKWRENGRWKMEKWDLTDLRNNLISLLSLCWWAWELGEQHSTATTLYWVKNRFIRPSAPPPTFCCSVMFYICWWSPIPLGPHSQWILHSKNRRRSTHVRELGIPWFCWPRLSVVPDPRPRFVGPSNFSTLTSNYRPRLRLLKPLNPQPRLRTLIIVPDFYSPGASSPSPTICMDYEVSSSPFFWP